MTWKARTATSMWRYRRVAERRADHASRRTIPIFCRVHGDVSAPDAYDGAEGRGHLWDAALRAHLTVRNYGFYCDGVRIRPAAPGRIPVDRDPFQIENRRGLCRRSRADRRH